MEAATTTYEPDNSLKRGYIPMLGDIFSEIYRNRWLTYQLFKRDFLAVYKQSLIGVLWAVIVPTVSVATFIILNRAGVFSTGDIQVPYPLYAILGMAFWQLFSSGLIAASNSLVSAGGMIVKINFSRKSLVIASTGQSIIFFLIQMSLVILLFTYYGIKPHPPILLLPILTLPIILLTVGLGFILSLVNGVVRDIGNLLPILTTFLLLLTPILYSRPSTGLLGAATTYNPLYYLVSTPRDMILFGTYDNLKPYLLSSVFSLITFTVCAVAFHLAETRVAERI